MIKCYGYECEVRVGRYPADPSQIWVQLLSPEGETIAVATVCIIPEELPFDFPEEGIFIKSWSENLGMIDILADQQVIAPQELYVTCGFESAQMALLLPPYMNEVPEL